MSDKLSDDQEVLFRQVHPTFLENGVPSSQPFKPTEKDKNLLSVDRSSITSAQLSYDSYVAAGFESSAVYGLAVGEFGSEKITCKSDPIEEDPYRNPAHSTADYSAHTSNQQKNVAKRLKQKALARGCLYFPSKQGRTSSGNASEA